jgi:hypothetical protein
MMRDAPRTLEGIYRYTLGAFPQMKFAFPLWAIPDRIAAFSLGVYAGERGWTVGPPSIAGPGGPLQVPPVVRFLASRDSRQGEAQARWGSYREEVPVSHPSARLVTYPLEGQM